MEYRIGVYVYNNPSVQHVGSAPYFIKIGIDIYLSFSTAYDKTVDPKTSSVSLISSGLLSSILQIDIESSLSTAIAKSSMSV
jgi:hypothetical protein